MVAVIGGVLLALLPAVPASALTPGVAFSSTASSTWQVNSTGIVWALGASHGKVIAGGTFTQLIPPSGGTGAPVNVNGLAILDAETGAPDSCQLPLGSATSTVRAITVSPDGNTVYIAGEFGSVGGIGRSRVAAIDVVDCKVLPFVSALPSSTVRALAVKNNTLYMGGDFLTVGGQSRGRFAAVDATTGQLLGFQANVDAPGRAVAVSPDGTKVAIGGDFFNVNSAFSHSIAIVDATTGANLKTYSSTFLPSASVTKAIYSGTDGRFYVGNEGTGGGIFDGRFAVDWATGNQVWRDVCLGATQAVLEYQDTLYAASHAHNCSPIGSQMPGVQQDGWQDGKRNFFNAETADTGQMLGWSPNANDGIGEGLGPRAMVVATGATTGKDYLWYGGEFTKVNNATQQGLTRFGPDDLTKPPTVTQVAAQATSEGAIQLRWRSVVDTDDSELTYNVYRDGSSSPIWTGGASSVWWKRPQLSFVDTAVNPGESHSYRIRVSDGTNLSPALSTAVSATAVAPAASYSATVRADSPKLYWGSTAAGTWLEEEGASTSDTRRPGGQLVGPTASADSPVADASGSLSFNGSSDYAWNDEYAKAPSTYTIESWIKTSTTRGGEIVGYGNGRPRTDTGATILSDLHDRTLYMENGGKVDFNVCSAGTVSSCSTRNNLQTPTALNNGAWHQVVGSQGPNGMSLYVDGKLVASNAVTASWSYLGVWHLGGDQLNGVTNRPTSNYFAGLIDNTSVYDGALGGNHVLQHFNAAGGTVTTQPRPTDSYGGAVYDADPDLYWRLDETSGSTAKDFSYLGSRPGVYGSGVTKNQAGAVPGDAGIKVVNSTSQTVGTTASAAAPKTYSAEAWFNTTSTTGGKILGFENTQTGNGTAFDKMVYMDSSGRLSFGTQNGTTSGTKSVLTTTGSYRDGTWHQVVATQSSNGMKLYVDGALAASNAVTTSLNTAGYWRVGGGALTGWPNAATTYFTGGLDEFAVYPKELTAATVANHYGLGLNDTVAPSAPGNVAGSYAGGNVSLTWTPSTDDTGVAKYRIYRDVTDTFVPSATNLQGETTTASFSQTAPGAGTYYYKVIAVDGAGNASAESTPAASVVVTDTTPPSTPQGVTASPQSGGQVTVAWQAASDNVAVTGYDVYRGTTAGFTPDAGSKLTTTPVTATAYNDTGVPSGTFYYKVIALDAAGNASQPSVAATATVGQSNQAVTVPVSPAADAYVNSTTPTTNYGVATGTGAQLASRDGSATVSAQQMFLKFTLPTAPAGTTLTAARLSLRTSTDPTANTTDPTSFRVLGNGWTEAGINWNNRPTGTGPLFGTLASAPALNTAYPVDGDVSTLAGLLGGDVTLRGTTGGSAIDSLRTFSREWGTASARPVLTLTFSPGADDTDSTPPDAVDDLTATAGTDADANKVTLGWTAPTDDVGVTGYSIYRSTSGGFTPGTTTKIAETTSPGYTDTLLSAGQYYYEVVARDAANNASTGNNEATVTLTDGAAPSAPAGLERHADQP